MLESLNCFEIWKKFEEGEQELEQTLQSSSSLMSILRPSPNIINDAHIWKIDEYFPASLALYQMAADTNLSLALLLRILQYGGKTAAILPKNNDTAIHRLAWCHNYQALEVLLDLKMLMSIPSVGSHRTPLHMAISSSISSKIFSEARLKTVKILCSVCPINNIDVVNSDGQSALHAAFSSNQVMECRALLKMNASVLVNIDLYAQIIPQIGVFKTIFVAVNNKSQLTLQQDLTNLLTSGGAMESYPPCLRQYLQPTYVPEFMVDYSISRMRLKWSIWNRGLQSVLIGMILFRLREEFRQLRKAPNTVPISPWVAAELNSEEKDEAMTDEETRAFELAIKRRNRFRQDRRNAKKATLQARKEQTEQAQEQRRRQVIKDKLEKSYEVKISGLFA